MPNYNVHIDLDSFTYYVKARDEQTAKDLAVKAMNAYIKKYLNDEIGIADVVADEDELLLDDSYIEIFEDE